MHELAKNRTLWFACLWTVATALAGREVGLGAACGVALIAIFLSLWQRHAGPWIWALPAAFAASHPKIEPILPRPGPVWIHGVVRAPVHLDRADRRIAMRVISNRQEFLCIVVDVPRDQTLLPGDTIAGAARFPTQPRRLRDGRPPRVIVTYAALRCTPGGPGGQRFATLCRLKMQAALLAVVPGEPGRLLCLLALGSGPRLTSDLPSQHRATGLSHLLAVSGAHLTMLGWMLGLLFHLVLRRSALESRWFRYGCAAILLLYGGIAGMQPPVFRAVVASFIFFIGVGQGRRIPISAVLTLPAILTALIAPADLFSVSFNLSYAAVIGLFLSNALSGRTTFERLVRGPLVCSLWASLCTMPLTLWYFGRIAPWAILATPLLSPLVALLLGLSLFVCTAASLVPGLPWLLSWPLSGLAQVYAAAVGALALLPLAPVYATAQPTPLALVIAGTAGGIGLLYFRNRRGVAFLCVALAVPHFLPASASTPALKLLAVGHGHAALLQLPNGLRVLVDCGTLGPRRPVTRSVATATLPARHLDWLIVTHADLDHIGCIQLLLDRVRVARALLPDDMRDDDTTAALVAQGCAVHFLRPGERRQLARGLLVHRPNFAGGRNDQSAWVHADFGAFRALLPGDALEAGITAWLASDLATTAEVLVLPHHGRENQLAAKLLARVRPALALVSSRRADGESAQGQVARRAGCQVLHTGFVGTIEVRATTPPTIRTELPLPLGKDRK